MTDDRTEYYVYVYIDPRNFEEFYYGKGTGDRKNAHLTDDSDSDKAKRIKAIDDEGLKPIIKVIAKDLTEVDAFLIEKTLIWKLGKNLTNKSSGHFADKFRPHDTFHQDLPGFDFKNGVYYINVGEDEHRCWIDCKNFGFLSAGGGRKHTNPFRTLEAGDIVAAYLKDHGYVGIGRVIEKAVPISEFVINGKSIIEFELKISNILIDRGDDWREYTVKIEWLKVVDSIAKWESGLFSSQQIKASLQRQNKTIEFLEKEFDVKLNELLL